MRAKLNSATGSGRISEFSQNSMLRDCVSRSSFAKTILVFASPQDVAISEFGKPKEILHSIQEDTPMSF